MARVKYLSAKCPGLGEKADLSKLGFPNFHGSGSITAMKALWGKDVLLVRQGNYIYNVSSQPAYYKLAQIETW